MNNSKKRLVKPIRTASSHQVVLYESGAGGSGGWGFAGDLGWSCTPLIPSICRL